MSRIWYCCYYCCLCSAQLVEYSPAIEWNEKDPKLCWRCCFVTHSLSSFHYFASLIFPIFLCSQHLYYTQYIYITSYIFLKVQALSSSHIIWFLFAVFHSMSYNTTIIPFLFKSFRNASSCHSNVLCVLFQLSHSSVPRNTEHKYESTHTHFDVECMWNKSISLFRPAFCLVCVVNLNAIRRHFTSRIEYERATILIFFTIWETEHEKTDRNEK